MHFKPVLAQFLPQNSYHRVLGEVKYVEVPMIECSNRANGIRDELYGRFKPYIEGLCRL